MSRLLFVVPPLAGHVNPLVGVAAAAVARGHEVAWVGPCPVVRDLVGERVYPAGSTVERRPAGLRAYAALRFLWTGFLVPLADAMVPGVLAAVEDFGPDLLVVDQQAFAGALVASRLGLPWVTSASTSAELSDPLGALPRIADWVREQQRGLRARHGVEGEDDLRFSPHSVVVFSTAELAGEPAVRVAGPLFVGPSLAPRRPVLFPWARLRPGGRIVLVTLGTTNSEAGGRFLAECALALAEVPELQGVLVDPGGFLVGVADTVVVPAVPQLELMTRAAAVVCHGGHNTVCEALAHGVPLVIAPIRDDQPVLADQVVGAGAGVRLRFDHVRAGDIARAVRTVVGDPAYALAAGRVRGSFERAGGAEAVVSHVEDLLRAVRR
ncbi:nucleotide disphospho-sugar-binding domain-containing protein [Actinokineospora sp. NBRC 105648]|uniref:glycosyltransferase n=1 Tax=Actinokineospora sp. NBRC 105648 TaxID=3032206 RepID=UPI0024A06421|nr:nucleotide disphospho-sugar-binding domain-containing protein [Actinokineospora sp. NBRC 105648]GLZ41823.1 glycosyl transferase [Actinokineospora sp. NBRC 105648]